MHALPFLYLPVHSRLDFTQARVFWLFYFILSTTRLWPGQKGMFSDLKCIIHLLSAIKHMNTDENLMYEKAKYFYSSGHYYRRLM